MNKDTNFSFDFMDDGDEFAALDRFLAYVAEHMPSTFYVKLNTERYKVINDSIKKLLAFMKEAGSEVKYKISTGSMHTDIILSVEAHVVGSTKLDVFREGMKEVDSFDVCPLANGHVELVFGYDDAFVFTTADDPDAIKVKFE